MLAYVIHSTGAPVCVLIPLSTWAVFYAGVVGEEAGMVSYGSGMDIYIQSLPFILYGWVAVIVVPLVIFRIIPMFGPMKKAYELSLIHIWEPSGKISITDCSWCRSLFRPSGKERRISNCSLSIFSISSTNSTI